MGTTFVVCHCCRSSGHDDEAPAESPVLQILGEDEQPASVRDEPLVAQTEKPQIPIPKHFSSKGRHMDRDTRLLYGSGRKRRDAVPKLASDLNKALGFADDASPRSDDGQRTPGYADKVDDTSPRPDNEQGSQQSSDSPTGEETSDATSETMSESISETTSSKTLDMLMLKANVSKALHRFKGATEKGMPPSEQDLERGVHIESIYDFYNPATKAIRQRPLRGDVLHVRPVIQSEPLKAEGSSADESAKSSSSTNSSSSSSAAKRSSASKKNPSRCTDRKQGDEFTSRPHNVEAVTRWGTLVGQILHKRVLDFTAAGDKAMQRRKIGMASQHSEKSGNVFLSIRERARAVVDQARLLARQVEKEPTDSFDAEWSNPDILVHMFSQEFFDTLVLLAKAALKIVSIQPVLVELKAPCRIFGDLHGQVRDLLLFLRAFGAPDDKSAPLFVFNGDFVDRGAHQVEVIGLLLALKVLLPDRVWLVRGNHEEKEMNLRYGFGDACTQSLGKANGKIVFNAIQLVFDQLPLGCVIDSKILVVHGGIGNGAWGLHELRELKRPLDNQVLRDPHYDWVNNIMWSDPIEDDQEGEEAVFGVHPSPRGAQAIRFAWNVTKTFCARNGLSLIVRSHQSKRDSLSFDIMHDNLLVRVFSARDYEAHSNDGAVLLVAPSKELARCRCGQKAPRKTKVCDNCGASLKLAQAQVKDLLKVRLQVIRSVQKSRDEAKFYELQERGQGIGDVDSAKGKKFVKRADTASMACRHHERRLSSGAMDFYKLRNM